MKRILLSCLLLLAAPAFADAKQDLHKLLDEIWQFQLEEHPVMATRYGLTEHNHELEDLSPATLKRINSANREFLSRLNNIKIAELDRVDQISHQVQAYYLKNEVDAYEFGRHMLPFTSESGFFSALAFLPNTHQFSTEQDYQQYLSRLSKFPRYFEQQIYWLKQGIEKGMTQPKVIMNGLPETVENFYNANATQSTFYRPFKTFGKDIDDAAIARLQKQAKAVIEAKVFPAYKRFHDFLVEEYIPNAKDDIAAYSWPNGEAYYQNRTEHFTTTDMSVDAIHQLGLKEVARIRAEMQDVIKSVGFEGSFKEFVHFLRTDPQFYAKSEKELMHYAAYLSKRIDGKLPKLFSYLPRTPYGVEPVPASIAAKYTTGRYISPSNKKEPGYYWVNTYKLDKRPLYSLPALTLHEAVPGHHLQIALAMELEGLPKVRTDGYISAFGEGWGLYSEYLGKEVDFYETPYDDFGRLSYEMWRAARLVVDTGMHSKGWSRQQSIDFMLENTALSELNIISEIDRYISWPAQALSYKIGELTIKRLRAKAETTLKQKFDVRAFHKAVLEHGPVPLSVLEQNIDIYIKEALN
ncbi:DUF885 domain-containing protein [Alteromonas sp. a30]|uniref:DUF885 domain-containing protein n=1 Tax=Alteromonas sp. a30 TaxID=2730917 RepID=UPI002280EAFE|nr:DUF885 domain-containing protein [Alteromonas sp. a30]MCY7295775.1 DUF885 domain-containing protein [Alteromonas sp. a30]